MQRLADLGLGTPSAYSEMHFGAGNRNTLSKVFRGERKLATDDLLKLSEALNAYPDEVLDALGYDVPTPVAAVVGTVNARGTITPCAGDAMDAPADLHGVIERWHCVRVDEPAGLFGGGECLFFDASPRYGLSETVHRLCVVREETGDATLCKVLALEKRERLAVMTLSGERRTTARVALATRVIWCLW